MVSAETTRVPTALWLSIEQASIYSGLSKPALLRVMRQGGIVYMRDHNQYRISRASLERFSQALPQDFGESVRPIEWTKAVSNIAARG